MKHLMLLPALALAIAMPAQTASQTTTTSTTTTTKKRTTHHKAAPKRETTSEEIRQLREMVQQQQQQISAMQQQMSQAASQRDAQTAAAQQQAQAAATAAQAAQSKADEAAAQAAQAQQQATTVSQDVQTVQTNATNTSATVQETQKRIGALESPTTIHFKGITITPGGFLAAESVYRTHATGGDINTAFNSIPFHGADNARQSEFFGSGRQSRLSLLASGKHGSVTGTGYYEADFLSAGVTSNNNESNSYTLRQRQAFVQAGLASGWTFTGGQMWSLVTETKKGLDNRTEALPMTIDPQYHVGFSWARQYGLRVVKNFGNKFWLGVSAENPQVLVTAHGNASNFDLGGPGLGGGLYNSTANYSYNESPDFIVKAAFEPGFGHYEIFGIESQFRDRVYPNATATTPSAVGAYNASKHGGGFGANARMTFAKKIDFGVHFLGGDGIGRYGTSTLPDTTVKPDGTLSLLHGYQALGTLEFHSTHWDWYANAGGEYASRSYFLTSAGKPEGYGSPSFNNSGCLTEAVPTGGNGFSPGSPANCNADTRNILEGTLGFWYKFYNGQYGRLQFGPQYSYIQRSTWRGIGGTPSANENMLLTSFRYYLP